MEIECSTAKMECNTTFFFLTITFVIYLFIDGCVGSSFLCEGFL